MKGNDVTITAFDGQSWGSIDVTVARYVDPPAMVTGSSISLHATKQLFP